MGAGKYFLNKNNLRDSMIFSFFPFLTILCSLFQQSFAVSSAPTASWPTSVWKRSSSSIDSDGFLVEIFDVIDACDDESLRLNIHRRMRVRQVPLKLNSIIFFSCSEIHFS